MEIRKSIVNIKPALYLIALSLGSATIIADEAQSIQGGVAPSEHETLPIAIREPLRIGDAINLALSRSPRLRATQSGLKAAEASLRQAGRLPNPSIEMVVGEYNRGGAGFDSAESEIFLSQPFELGGKRQKRRQVAMASRDLVQWGLASERIALVADTKRDFSTVLANQQRLKLATEIKDTILKTTQVVASRVSSGKETPMQLSKAQAELEMAKLDVETASNRLEASRIALAQTWAGSAEKFGAIEGSLAIGGKNPVPLERLGEQLRHNPAYQRWSAVIEHREALLESEKSARLPDIELSAGLQQFEEDGTQAFAVALGFPLPVFDRNTDNVIAAQGYLEEARARRRSAINGLQARIASLHADWDSARKLVFTLENNVIPSLLSAQKAAREGYKQGKYSFLELLDAQRGVFSARRRLIYALEEYAHIQCEIDKIAGEKIRQD